MTVAASGSPPPEGLRDRDDIGDDGVLFEPEHRPEPPEPRLSLVDDEQPAPLVRGVCEAPEIAGRRVDDTPGGEHRLGDRGGERTRAVGVKELEAPLHAAHVAGPAAGRVFAPRADRATVRIRRGERE